MERLVFFISMYQNKSLVVVGSVGGSVFQKKLELVNSTLRIHAIGTVGTFSNRIMAPNNQFYTICMAFFGSFFNLLKKQLPDSLMPILLIYDKQINISDFCRIIAAFKNRSKIYLIIVRKIRIRYAINA